MNEHKSYEEVFNRKAAFRVKYELYSYENGGRYPITYQGTRFNFWYEHSEHKKGMLFMIWPEFENVKGEVISENDIPINNSGTARMWIFSDEFIEYHREKIQIGTKGFFVEGDRTIGECVVIELINLG
jgi:hypothetical protein